MPSDSNEGDWSGDYSRLSGPTIDRRTALELFAAAGLTGLAGCSRGTVDQTGTTSQTSQNGMSTGGGDTETTTPSSDIQTGGRLKVGWATNKVPKLDPTKITVGQYYQLAANIFNGLVMLKPDLSVEGDLASDWTVSSDGKQFTFTLRKGVTFHDGTKFTADDVKYSIKRTIDEKTVNASKLSTLKPIDQGGVDVKDDYTVALNFEKAFAPALAYLTRGPGRAAAIVSKEAIQKMGEDKYLTEPVGTGPFKVKKHDVGNILVLDAFGDYFKTDGNGNPIPRLDGVDVHFIPEPATLINSLKSGDIQFANLVPLQNLSDVKSAQRLNVLTQGGPNWYGMIMNMREKPFDSTTFRRGVAKCIDKDALVQTAYFGNAVPAQGPISPAFGWAYRKQKSDTQAYDPEAGKSLLKKAGAENAKFSIMTSPTYERVAKVVRKQLIDAGLNVDINKVPTSEYWDNMAKNKFDMAIDGSVGDSDPDQSLYNFYRQPDQGGVWNYDRYYPRNSEHATKVNQLLGEQRRELDRSKRASLLAKAEDLIIDDVPHAFVSHTYDVVTMNEKVHGYVDIPYMRYFDNIWLEQ